MPEGSNIIPYAKKALDLIKKREASLESGNYEVLEIVPDRNNPKAAYQLAGSKEQLVQSTSSFLATTQFIGERFGDWDFEKFDLDYRNAFYRAVPRPLAWGDVTNPWNRPIRQQPKLVELNNPLEDGYKLVAFYPDKTNDDEVYPLVGSINDILNQLMTIHYLKMMLGDDLGIFVGNPVTEYIRHSPIHNVYILFQLHNRKNPPYRKKFLNFEPRDYQFTIHYPKLESLSYSNLRAVLGGETGLTWGYWKATAWITDSLENFNKGKAAHQIWVSGDTEKVARKNLDQVLTLTSGKVLRVNISNTADDVGTLKDDPERSKWKSFKVYPWKFTVFNPKLVAMAAKGQKITLAGKLNTRRNIFSLWQPKEPVDWSNNLREFLAAK